MFEIGEKIVNRKGKVCEITEIQEADYGAGMNTYYVLKPCFVKETSITFYIPISQEDKMRRVMNEKEALELIDEIPTVDPIWYNNPKVRKTKFTELYMSGNPLEIFRLIKSFEAKKEEFRNTKKCLSFTDETFLKEIERNIFNEMALALNIEPCEVLDFIKKRLAN